MLNLPYTMNVTIAMKYDNTKKNNEDNEYVDTIANIALFHFAVIEIN